MTDIAEIVAGLTKAARKALMASADSYILRKSDGAYSLWWGRNHGLGLVESPRWRGGTYTLFLTPLGVAVRAALLERGR